MSTCHLLESMQQRHSSDSAFLWNFQLKSAFKTQINLVSSWSNFVCCIIGACRNLSLNNLSSITRQRNVCCEILVGFCCLVFFLAEKHVGFLIHYNLADIGVFGGKWKNKLELLKLKKINSWKIHVKNIFSQPRKKKWLIVYWYRYLKWAANLIKSHK